MKYIRTKDGHIHKVINEQDKWFNCTTFMQNYQIYKEIVVNQADTIEELCDEFVLIENTRIPSKPVVMDIHKNGISDYFKNLKATIKCIYGAIWVDIKLPNGRVVKRLEPVAIMNEKGDWELL